MGLLDILKTAEDLAKTVLPKVEKRMLNKFPILDFVKNGRFPVPETVIETSVKEKLEEGENLKLKSLTCHPGHFKVVIETKKLGVKHRITANFSVKSFKLTKKIKKCILVCDQDIDIEGRNILGSLSVLIGHAIVKHAVKWETSKLWINEKSEGIVDLKWPEIILHLGKIAYLKEALAFDIMGKGLLDFIEITGCEIVKGNAVLIVEKMRWKKP